MSFESNISGKALDLGILKRIFSLVRPYRGKLYLAILVTIALALLGPAVPWLIQKTIDGAVIGLDSSLLVRGCSLILLAYLGVTLLSYVQAYLTAWLGGQAVHTLRTRVFNKISRLPLRIYDRTPVGTMITRTVSDVETVQDVFAEGLIPITGDLLQIITILTIMLSTNWRLSLVSLAVFPLLLGAAWLFKEAVRKAFGDVRTQVARLNAFLQEHITGMFIVQVFGRQKVEFDRFMVINGRHRDANIKSIAAYSIFFPVIEVLSAVAVAFIVWYGSSGILDGTTTLGTLVAFILYINLLFRPIRQVADKFNTLQMGMVAGDRIFRVLDMDENTPDLGKQVLQKMAGHIEFRNVWFAYIDENWILKDVSFIVEPGKTLAIVGHTGAGKTTITNLLNRMYPLNKGQILIDGIPIEEYPLEYLRSEVGVVLQDVFLLSDTISQNIRLFNPDISDAQITQAASLTGADVFINKLPGNYNYQVQERGLTLSTGQRQLISFMRAILQDPSVLVLDEATSSVDQETEELVSKATEVLLKDRTSIAIAHRLRTVQDAYQIIVLDKGVIVERGTHQELLIAEGAYYKLYQLQFAELVV